MNHTSDAPARKRPKFLKARCRTRVGGVTTIHVLDISIAGCVFDKRAMVLNVGERVLIKLPSLAYMAANVVWIEDGRACLVFEQPLYLPVLEYLLRCYIITPHD